MKEQIEKINNQANNIETNLNYIKEYNKIINKEWDSSTKKSGNSRVQSN